MCWWHVMHGVTHRVPVRRTAVCNQRFWGVITCPSNTASRENEWKVQPPGRATRAISVNMHPNPCHINRSDVELSDSYARLITITMKWIQRFTMIPLQRLERDISTSKCTCIRREILWFLQSCVLLSVSTGFIHTLGPCKYQIQANQKIDHFWKL